MSIPAGRPFLHRFHWIGMGWVPNQSIGCSQQGQNRALDLGQDHCGVKVENSPQESQHLNSVEVAGRDFVPGSASKRFLTGQDVLRVGTDRPLDGARTTRCW